MGNKNGNQRVKSHKAAQKAESLPRSSGKKLESTDFSEFNTETFHFIADLKTLDIINVSQNFSSLTDDLNNLPVKISHFINPVETSWADLKKILTKGNEKSFIIPGFLKINHDSPLHVDLSMSLLQWDQNGSQLSVVVQPSPLFYSGGSLHHNNEVINTLNFIGDCIIEIDRNKNIFFINESAIKLFRHIKLHGLDPDYKFYFNEMNGDIELENIIDNCIDKETDIRVENIHATDTDGNKVYLDILVRPVYTPYNKITGYVIIIRNLTGTHIISEKLKWLANHDSLTGILNRRAFEAELAKTIDYAKENNSSNVMMYLDLDQFKVINDICGHSAGDELLRTLSSKISIVLDENCTLARLGGDEFGIILENYTLETAMNVGNDLLDTIKKYEFYWGKKKYEIGVSIGMVPISGDSISISHIMSMADIACYTAKDLGRNRIHVFVGGEMEYMVRHGEMQWISHIKKALQENSFLLYSQKISPVAPESNLQEHEEILVRMKGDDGQIYPPVDFIGAAERYNVIKEIDRWVIYNTFKTIAEKNLREKNIVYSINLSGSTVNDATISIFISETMKQFHIPPKIICFEITESVAIENFSYAREFIRELKMIGFEFALDDFGSGLSSFNYLKNLPIDILKIDGHFVKNIHNDEIDYAMVKTIHNIGKTLKIKTVAEYVENKLIFDKIREIGIDYAQGFLLSHPEPFG
jgi:diguanylate cyclase (GGDEF)-like protein/PAS domain S-box-containing protein